MGGRSACVKNVIIPLNAFDRKEVLENGQIAFIKLIAASGAYGVEIRRELFTDEILPLKHLREKIAATSLFTVYSAPIELWKKDGSLNIKELQLTFQEADLLSASWVKTSLGHYIKGVSNLEDLKQFLKNAEVKLFVENDQTQYGGNISDLKHFFESAYISDVPVRMTFDTGNWMYTNEKWMDALMQLKEFVAYLHLKNVIQNGKELTTIALSNNENAAWRFIAGQFPIDLPKALEFPIAPVNRLREYVEMVETNKTYKEGEVLCKS